MTRDASRSKSAAPVRSGCTEPFEGRTSPPIVSSDLPSRPITVRPFEGRDTQALLEAWAKALPADAVTLDQFERRILLDQNYERDGLLVAEVPGSGDSPATLAGFAACFVLNKPIEKVGHREDTGFISMFGVVPAGAGGARDGAMPEWGDAERAVGEALLAAAEAFFRGRGRRLVVLSPYTPNYFVPGVDKDRYAPLLRFLEGAGFREYSEALAADALIARFEIPAEVLDKERALAAEGIEIRPYRREDLASYLQFQRDLMPGPWVEDARYYLLEMAAGRFPEDAIWLAVDSRRDGRIIAFCMHDREHFGPFGVSDEYQGRGIGTVLLARTLERMRMRGCHCAWVLWTGERALKGVYGRLGFTLTRRFAILKKELA